MSSWLGVFGRLHPAVLHLPIGLLVGLAVLELVSLRRRAEFARPLVSLLAWLAAVAAVLAAASGWVLHLEEGYDPDTLELHQWLGIAVAVASVLVALTHALSRHGARPGWLKAYRAALALAVLLVLPAGHFGATLTHGSNFLFEPLEQRTPAAAPVAEPAAAADPAAPSAEVASGVSYAATIAPILASRCAACHGETKKKGGLSLADAAAIRKGGKDGPVLVAGRPEQSELLHRLKLPLDDDDHMPPDGKPQPTAEQIQAIEAWIAAGAPFDGSANSAQAEPASASPAEQGPPPADGAALAALEGALVHVEALEAGSNLLVIDFAAAAPLFDDAQIVQLLEPLRAQIAELALARTRAGEATLALAARMPELRRLDLRATPTGDAALARLGPHARLRELVLARTQLTDAAVDTLLALPELEKVWLWKSGVSPQALERLRDEAPELAVDAGDAPLAAALEVGSAIAVGTPAAPAPSLEPINKVCPVSGSPVDPAYTIVFRGRVIGFCCPNCPKQFWADPAQFESKLP